MYNTHDDTIEVNANDDHNGDDPAANSEFQCDCVCSCCCQCFPAVTNSSTENGILNGATSSPERIENNNNDDGIVRRRKPRKRRAKSGNVEQLLVTAAAAAAGNTATNTGASLVNRRNSAYCVCKLEIKFVW